MTLGRITVVLASVVVVAAVVMATLFASPAPPSEDVADSLNASAAVIDQHATDMIDRGRRFLSAVAPSTHSLRDAWVLDGQRTIADGASLVALAGRIRAAAALLGESPTERPSIDVGFLSGAARCLHDDGQLVTEHVARMRDHAGAMRQFLDSGGTGISEADVRAMETDAAVIDGAGATASRLGERLQAFVEGTSRGLGVVR